MTAESFVINSGDVVTVEVPEPSAVEVVTLLGPQGPIGPAGTITIGTVTTGNPGSSATITNTGTATAAVLSVSLPRGDTGAAGSAGPTGAVGATGPAGTTSWDGLVDKPAVIAAGATQALARTAIGAEASANKGAANGYASLDSNGLVPSTQLPSYVDDVVSYTNLAGFPATGDTGKIYVANDTGKIYRWSGSAYIEISGSPGSTDAVPEGSTNLYFTSSRAQSALTGQLAGKSDVGHGHAQSDITGLVSDLANKANAVHSHAQSDVTGLTDALAGKLATGATAAAATKLATARTLGPVDLGATGSASFDGTANVTPGVTGSLPQSAVTNLTTDLAGKLGTGATAAAATKLATARTISGVSFDGTANIDVVTPATVGINYFPQGYVSGNYYYTASPQAAATSGALVNNSVRVYPWVVTANVSITRIFAEFTAAGDANSILRIGVWNHDATTGKPGSLLFEAGSISTGSGNAGTVATGGTPGTYEITVSQTINAGFYWVGGVVQGATTTQPTIRTTNLTTIPLTLPLGTSLPTSTFLATGFGLNGVTGALGSLASAVTQTIAAPRIGFRVA